MTHPSKQMQEILQAHAAMGPLPVETLTPELARLIPLLDRAAFSVYGHHFTKKALAPLPMNVGHVEHIAIPGPGSSLMARVYTPKGKVPYDGWPVLVYFHGGGWVIATLDTYDSSCRALCSAASCVVISVHYRQAPEHKWPAAPNDALAAWQWVCENAQRFDGDPTSIAVAGESAGGNLAAIVALHAQKTGARRPVHQLLIYPVTDLHAGVDSHSAHEHEDAKPLNTAMLKWFYDHYLPEGAERRDPLISPLYTPEMGDAPPATIILAEIDPLRSDGEAYAKKLALADVPVTLKIYNGMTHEFFGMSGLVNEAAQAQKIAADNLRTDFRNHLRKAA